MTIYLISEALLFILIKIFEFTDFFDATSYLEYASIFINTVAATVLFLKGEKNRLRSFVFAALLLTLVSDTFLVLLGTENLYVYGVLSFCIVEALYSFSMKVSRTFRLIRVITLFVSETAVFLLGMGEIINYFAVFSITELIFNVIAAFILSRKTKKSGENPELFRLFSLGLLLFFFCDINVGLYNLTGENLNLQNFNNVCFFLMWFFYLPGQVLIASSLKKPGSRNKSE